MTKTILILAASKYQIPVIEAAKKLGMRVITSDNNPQNPGHQIADQSYNIDTIDKNKILQIAIKEKIHGIISPASDISVTTASFVANKLNLPGPKLETAQILTNKLAFRSFLKINSLPHPEAYSINQNNLPDKIIWSNSKWIIKPNCSSGSKGVFILNNKNEFDRYYKESISFSKDKTCILEEYISGTQHTCEGILENGKIVFYVITDRDTVHSPHTTTNGHRVPSQLNACYNKNCIDSIESIFKLLGESQCIFDCDFIVSNNKIMIIEISPRIGENSLLALIQHSIGFDLAEYAIKQACGIQANLPETLEITPTATLILGVNTDGNFDYDLNYFNKIEQELWLKYIQFDYPIKYPVKAFINGRHRLGEAVITASSRKELDHHIVNFYQRIKLQVN